MAHKIPATLSAYRWAMMLAHPFLDITLQWRLERGKELVERVGEKLGRIRAPRADGPLIWFHAASVGETNAILPLLHRIARRYPGVSMLLTTVTVTSANMVAERLPERAVHQFAALDTPRVVRQFLGHWQPSLAVFAESEIWPTTLIELNKRQIPTALINGRMSEKSASRWRLVPKTICWLLSAYDVCLVQSDADLRRFQSLGANHAVKSGNVKFDVPAPPASAMDLAGFRSALGERPVWVAASTHPGEDTIVLEAHKRVQRRLPDLVTLIVPRHPERAGDIMAAAKKYGLKAGLRSKNRQPAKDDQVFVFDTIGELGLAYRLTDIAFIGGSLAKRGGQNPIEPAKLETAILHGPFTFNFADAYAALQQGGGAEQVDGPLKLAQSVERLFTNSAARRLRAAAALDAIKPLGGALETSFAALVPHIENAVRDKAT